MKLLTDEQIELLRINHEIWANSPESYLALRYKSDSKVILQLIAEIELLKMVNQGLKEETHPWTQVLRDDAQSE